VLKPRAATVASVNASLFMDILLGIADGKNTLRHR
jgi:hypothetical protein